MPEVENTKAVTQVSVDVNLGAMVGQLQRAVQRTMNLVCIGLQSRGTLVTEHLELPDTSVALSIDSGLRWDTEFAKTEFANWALVNGFRDASEAVGAFLESVRAVVAFWSLAASQVQEGRLSVTDWKRKVVDEAKKFHRFGFPHKLEFLEKEYALSLDPDLVA
jgi:hypothetical protein